MTPGRAGRVYFQKLEDIIDIVKVIVVGEVESASQPSEDNNFIYQYKIAKAEVLLGDV